MQFKEFCNTTVTHSSLGPSLVPHSGSFLPRSMKCEGFTRNFSYSRVVEKRQRIVLWEQFLCWPDGSDAGFDDSSLGNCVFTKRAGDAQTNYSTMTNEDNGFRKKRRDHWVTY